MNLALSLVAASITFAQQAPPASVAGNPAKLTSLARVYKVGDESTYAVSMSDPSGAMHIGGKVRVKTVALLDGGKATQELTASEFSGGPDGAGNPEKVAWTFGKDGMAAADFSVNSGSMIYSILSMMSFVPGQLTPGKDFKISWTSPDKASTITGSGTFEGIKEVKGVKVAVIKTTTEVSPGGDMKATVHNTANFDPANGRLISADGTVDLGGQEMTLTVTSG